MKKYQAEEMHQGWEASTGASEPSRESIEGEDEEEEEEDWANIDEGKAFVCFAAPTVGRHQYTGGHR